MRVFGDAHDLSVRPNQGTHHLRIGRLGLVRMEDDLPVLDQGGFDAGSVPNNGEAGVHRTGQSYGIRSVLPQMRLQLIGLSDAEVAEQIRADDIDVLVDLAGHTGGNRLLVFARRPAPVQVSYLGYLGTTGLDVIDGYITDALAE